MMMRVAAGASRLRLGEAFKIVRVHGVQVGTMSEIKH
jgi:hypothetical protein